LFTPSLAESPAGKSDQGVSMKERQDRHQQALAGFGGLPDEAAVAVQVAAAVTGTSVPTIWRRIGDGTLSVVRIGRCTRVSVRSIRALLNAGAAS
jgi:predicted DNA-binding transcriptional regulator AlpA